MSALFVDPAPPALPTLSGEDVAWCYTPATVDIPAVFKSQMMVNSSSVSTQNHVALLSAVGGIAACNRMDVLQRLVVPPSLDAVPEGLGHHFYRFFGNDLWNVVGVDERVPVLSASKVAAFGCTSTQDMWLPMLEKAFAKYHGNSYQTLHNNLVTSEVLHELTGRPVALLRKGCHTVDAVWTNLFESLVSGEFLIMAERSPSVEDGCGLLPAGFAYGVLGAQTINGQRLVLLRDVWRAKTEWRGSWGRESKELTECGQTSLVTSLQRLPNTLLMPIEDFSSRFSDILLVFVGPKNSSSSSTETTLPKAFTFKSEWNVSKGTAGGCTDNQSWITNPQFGVINNSLTDPAHLLISLTQQSTTATSIINRTEYEAIGFILVRLLENPKMKRTKIFKGEMLGTSGPFINLREICVPLTLPPGHGCAIIPSTFAAGKQKEFTVTLTVTNSQAVEIHPLKEVDASVEQKKIKVETYMPKGKECAYCQAIVPDGIPHREFLGADGVALVFHMDCYRCCGCERSLTKVSGSEIKQMDPQNSRKLYCPTCSTLCSGCGAPIASDSFTQVDENPNNEDSGESSKTLRLYHKACVVCSRCHEHIQENESVYLVEKQLTYTTCASEPLISTKSQPQ